MATEWMLLEVLPTGIRDDSLSSGLSTGPSFHRPLSIAVR